VIGFVFGVAGMYYYIHHSDDALSGAGQWMERSASHYRGDRDHDLVNEQTGSNGR
jgi:hypothetical protein